MVNIHSSGKCGKEKHKKYFWSNVIKERNKITFIYSALIICLVLNWKPNVDYFICSSQSFSEIGTKTYLFIFEAYLFIYSFKLFIWLHWVLGAACKFFVVPGRLFPFIVAHALSSCGTGSVAVAPGLSCSEARGVLASWPGTESASAALLNPWTTRDVPAMFTLQMRELRLRGVKLVQDHTPSERQSLNENLGLTPKLSLITKMLYYFPCDRRL